MGSCVKASPAKTISPTLSLVKLSVMRESICLAFSRRLGWMSSAIIELETSRQTMISTPRFFTVSSLEPNCGPAITKIITATAAKKSQNFRCSRLRDTSGMSSATSFGSPKRRTARRRSMRV